MMETTTFIASPKIKISLIKVAKGYRWSVEVTHEDPEEALSILRSVEENLRHDYGATS